MQCAVCQTNPTHPGTGVLCLSCFEASAPPRPEDLGNSPSLPGVLGVPGLGLSLGRSGLEVRVDGPLTGEGGLLSRIRAAVMALLGGLFGAPS